MGTSGQDIGDGRHLSNPIRLMIRKICLIIDQSPNKYKLMNNMFE